MSGVTSLPGRIRLTGPTQLYVSPNGTDAVGFGREYGVNGNKAFATPGYAVAWCGANLDACGQSVAILVDGNHTYTTTPVDGAIGGITLFDVPGTNGSWSQQQITVCGAINGVAITSNTPDSSWPGLSFVNMPAICGVGVSTVWNFERLQLQSTVGDIESDRGSKINCKYLVHGIAGSLYPSPYKYIAAYKGSIEILAQIWINSGGTSLWFAGYQGDIIGVGSAPIYGPGVSFISTTTKDTTSFLALPGTWPQ